MNIDWGFLALITVAVYFFAGLAYLVHSTEGFKQFFSHYRKQKKSPERP